MNPCYQLLSDNIYYLIDYLIDFIIKFNYEFKYVFNFIFIESPEIFELIASCIYLEIIELRFCNLNTNIRKNIILRGENDSLNIDNIDEADNNSDEEEEKNNQIELNKNN